MSANGWTTALKMTVNKDGSGSPCAVNLYPQGQNFVGNVAFRFSMYLSLVDAARGTTSAGTAGREFAIFGMDHTGTNANWRPSLTVQPGQGAGPTNWDGAWYAIDAGNGSLTPSDFDSFNSPALPNNNGTPDNDIQSNTSTAENGVFKNPPFTADSTAGGGNPANQWVEVDVEKRQTTTNGVFNMNLFIDRASVLTAFQNTAGIWTNGTVMLGYEDPLADVSDPTAFVYYSNMRVVELSPFLTVLPTNRIILSGTSLSFTNTATYVTVPGITNTWSTGITAPVTLLQTDTNNLTTLTSVLNAANITKGTNYIAVASDAAGSTTNVNVVEVIAGPANVTANLGAARAVFTVTPSGQSAPTSFQWQTNGVNIANGNKYANVTTASLSVSNIAAADGLVTYDCVVVNAAGTVTTPGATLTIVTAPSSAVVAPASTNALWGSSVTFSVTASGSSPFTYQWKKAGVNIGGATTSSLTLSAITGANAASYTAGVTNAAGGTVSSAGVLTINEPAPSFSASAVTGGNAVLSFTSPNGFDTTNAFILQSSPVVTGPYTNTPGTFTFSAGTFQVTTPQVGNNMFYRLLHAN
jgi:hypothetical protein